METANDYLDGKFTGIKGIDRDYKNKTELKIYS